MSAQERQRSRLRAELADAARIIAPQWPLRSWVAVNPLVGLTGTGFHDAIAEAARWHPLEGYPDRALLARASREDLVGPEDVEAAAAAWGEPTLSGLLVDEPPASPAPALGRAPLSEADQELARWLPALVADGAGVEQTAYARWRRGAAHDRRLRRISTRAALLRDDLPTRADDAVLAAVDELGVDPAEWSSLFRARLAGLPGWAGYARWSDEWATPEDPSPRLPLMDLLALQLTYDRLLGTTVPPAPPGPGDPAARREGQVILSALERGYARRLLTSLASAADRAEPAGPPASQAVFCIDARSEGLRRNLEAVGDHETLGFAGFFAVPMRLRPLGSTATTASAPVLVQPEVEVAEQVRPGHEADGERYVRNRRTATATADVGADLAHGSVTMFPTAEAAGWALGPVALARTLRPRLPARRRLEPPPTAMAVEQAEDHGGFSLEERVFVAETALRTMGLTRGFAPVVLFCGHGSTSTANAHAAALDCGACGGNPGGQNARSLAAILNDDQVRRALAERDVTIPETTWFLGGQHDTTLDTVELFDTELAPPEVRPAVEVLRADLERAAAANAQERVAQLGPSPRAGEGRREARRRAADWAQTRPEWGLVRNAAFIVAPRSLTAGTDLQGRAFLHSYRPEEDEDGTVLETILTAPMVVAQWINAQYYFSSVDPQRFGAGDKTLHNPVADLGVLEGGSGDLCVGLPWQSVADEEGLRHIPVRLLVIIQAPRERVDEVVARNPILSDLFDGEWVQLVAGSGPEDWKRWKDNGWSPAIDPPIEEKRA